MNAKPIRYLVLFVTGACNLRCRYCYAVDVPHEAMSLSVAEGALDAAAVSKERFHVQLTGGEPTLAPKRVEQIVSMIRRDRLNAGIGIQTNGTLLSDALIDILVRNQVEIGLSLDGIETVHNKERGMFKETIRGLTLLMKRQVPCRVTTVVTADSAPHLDKLLLMLAAFPNVRGVGLDLLTIKGGAVANGVAPVSPEALGDAVSKMRSALSFINRSRTMPLAVRELASSASTFSGCHASQGESLAVLPDGRRYPCSQTAGDPAFELPNPRPLSYEGRGDWKGRKAPLLAGGGLGERSEKHGDRCPARTHYNRGENLPLCRCFEPERMPQ